MGRLTYENWKEANGTSVYAFSYDYDLNANRTSGSILGVATYWEYSDADALAQKWTEPGPSEASYYSYDLDGNLELIRDLPGGSLTYFEHGSHGLVTRIHAPGSDPVTFAYDGLLRRIRMTEGATVSYFRQDGINFIETAKSDGTLTKVTHGHTPADGIGSAVEVEVGGTRYYLHQDHRGTIYKITDANENVVWTGLCDAFGVPLAETGTNPTIFQYQGEAWIRIVINGRTYYISPTRVYDPEDGRFLQRDPARSPSPAVKSVFHEHLIGHENETSLYVYALSSPTVLSDATGTIVWRAWPCIVCGACAGVAGVECSCLCAFTYWDDPDDSWLECWGKCIEAAKKPGTVFGITCYTACAVCGGVNIPRALK